MYQGSTHVGVAIIAVQGLEGSADLVTLDSAPRVLATVPAGEHTLLGALIKVAVTPGGVVWERSSDAACITRRALNAGTSHPVSAGVASRAKTPAHWLQTVPLGTSG